MRWYDFQTALEGICWEQPWGVQLVGFPSNEEAPVRWQGESFDPEPQDIFAADPGQDDDLEPLEQLGVTVVRD